MIELNKDKLKEAIKELNLEIKETKYKIDSLSKLNDCFTNKDFLLNKINIDREINCLIRERKFFIKERNRLMDILKYILYSEEN